MLTHRSLPHLRSDERGVALIEFAITLPLFVILLTGGLELTSLALTHLQLNRTAETMADNASRVRMQMDEFDISQIFEGVELQGESIDLATKGRVVISSIEDNGKLGSARGQKIRWQRCTGAKVKAPRYGREGKGASDNSLKDGIGPPGRRIAAQPGTAVMHAEVVYDYEPQIFSGVFAPHEIRYETAFNVRERDELGISNVKGRPVKGC